jgi:hypothetical protein
MEGSFQLPAQQQMKFSYAGIVACGSNNVIRSGEYGGYFLGGSA